MNKPLISIIMATFNESVEYITASIESILEQTYTNIELIIIDDSTDADTIEAINLLAVDNRIRVIRKNERIGFVKALNIGLKLAKGEYIARMDGDDVSGKGRIQFQINFLMSNKKIDVLGGSMNIINENGNIISKRSYPLNNNSLLLWSTLRSPLAHPTVMFRRKIVDQGFFYDENFSKSEDMEFWLRLRNNGFRFANLPDVLLNYRVIGDLASKRTKEHFKYNSKARLKNFSIKYCILDLFSIFIVKIYCILPQMFFSYLYASENNK